MFNHLLCVSVLFFSNFPDSSLSYTETVPPLLSGPPHITPRDYTGEWLVSLLHTIMSIARREMFVQQGFLLNAPEGGSKPANKFVKHELHECVCARSQMHACQHTYTREPRSPECLRKRVNYICWCYDIVLSFLFSNTVQTTRNCTA